MNFSGQFTRGPTPVATPRAVGEADFVLGLPNDIGRGLSNGTPGASGKTSAALFPGRLARHQQPDAESGRPLGLQHALGRSEGPPGELRLVHGRTAGRRQERQQPRPLRPLQEGLPAARRIRLDSCRCAAKKLVFRGAYTISSFMEGTGTNLRLTLNPPFNSEIPGIYQRRSAIYPVHARSGLRRLRADPFGRDHPAVGSERAPGRSPAVEPDRAISATRQQRAHRWLRRPARHAPCRRHALPQRMFVTPGQTPLPSPYLSGNPTLVSQITQISGTQSGANQRYDALQASLHKRFSKGIEYQLSYTWSNGMSDSIGYYGESGQSGGQSAYMQNLYDRRAEWGPMLADATHNFVASFYYELPFGRGKHFGGNWARPIDYAIGGWEVGGNFSAHTGFPLTIKTTDRSGTLARSARASVVGKANNSHIVGPGNHWLDVSAYTQPAAFTFGNAGVGTERGPGAKLVNLSLGKRFAVGEHKWFELRGEAFNLSNTPVFNSPISQTITASTYGEISTSSAERNVQVVAKFRF